MARAKNWHQLQSKSCVAIFCKSYGWINPPVSGSSECSLAFVFNDFILWFGPDGVHWISLNVYPPMEVDGSCLNCVARDEEEVHTNKIRPFTCHVCVPRESRDLLDDKPVGLSCRSSSIPFYMCTRVSIEITLASPFLSPAGRRRRNLTLD